MTMRHLFVVVLLGLCLSAASAQQVDPSGNPFASPGYSGYGNTQQQQQQPSSSGYGMQPGMGMGSSGTLNQIGTPSIRSYGSVSPFGTGLQQNERIEALENRPMRRIDRPPPKPSEFQKFVANATGRLLPVFGSRFFASAPDPIDALHSVPVSGDYVVGPGDELLIRAWGSIDVDYRATVDRNGQVSLPRVGTFSVAGVKASELEPHLQAQIGRLFTNFNLNVTLGQLRWTRVFVVGPAQWPGTYTLPSQSTLLSAVVAAGGPSPTGSMRRVSLRRDGKVVADLDIYDFLVRGDKSKDLQIANGDVVVFYPVGPQVAITGAIDTPAVYELKHPEEPTGDVLRYAGGAPVLANPNRVQLERIDPTQRAARYVEEFPLDTAGRAKPMRDGDVLTLLQISPKFANAVTLRGHVAQPLRYPYRPGMRITDLIPDKEALISPDFYRRKNLLVQVMEDDELRRDGVARFARGDRDPNRRRLGNGNADRDAAGGDGSREDLDRPVYVDGRLVSGGDPRASRERDRQRGVDGETTSPDGRMDASRADERGRPPGPLFDELNWDYAVIERLNREELRTQIIPFNLGRAVIHGDPSQNLELLPGDVVTVYSQKDVRVPVARQTRLVSLEGEVAAPGVYQLEAGETLRSLIARAGGLTPQAYAYGLEFSREQTRERQRENLKNALARLEALSATQAARDAANRNDRSTAVSNAATQAQIARLSRMEPNGRIALELSPGINSLDALPDVPLEHGDRISVPPRPGFVTVAGAVVNSNAFLWRSGRTAGDYVRLAGLDIGAEPENMFILRADGTVTHANDRRGFFGYGGVDSQVLQPGDAVIVPNQLDYETFGTALVRNLKDWSQIFSQFGLGIAAINAIKND